MLRPIIFFLSVFLSTAPILAFEPLFDTWTEYPVAAYPQGICVGDFNGDGNYDMAVSCYMSDTVSILFGNGDGTLQPPVNYGSGVAPNNIYPMDLDADGDIDLIMANASQSGIAVLLNDGPGTFSGPAGYCSGYSCVAVTVNDFDGDGDPDIAGVDYYGDAMAVIFNYGDGTFTGPSLFSTEMDPTSLVSADFDLDGDYDIAVANSLSGNVTVFTNNGHGFFYNPVDYGVGQHQSCIIAADFDADGDEDLAVSCNEGDSLAVLLNTGSGAFSVSKIYSGLYIENIFPADVDGDGDLDIITAATFWRSASIFVNDGTGQFSNNIQLDAQFNDVCAADFDKDGDADIAGAMGRDSQDFGIAGIISNTGGGQFPARVIYSVGYAPDKIIACDFDHDNNTDLATVNYGASNVSVLLNTGDGAFADSVNYPVGYEPQDMAEGDFNGDGNSDLAIVNHGPGAVSVLLGNGDGTFQPRLAYNAGTRAYWVGAGDFDNDNDCDLAVVCPYEIDSAYNLVTDSLYVLLNDNNTGFLPAVAYYAGLFPTGIVIFDIDADGTLDILVTTHGDEAPDSVAVLLNDGNGQFQPSAGYPIGKLDMSSDGLIAADLDGDGDKDIVVPCDVSSTVSVLFNNGDGTLSSSTAYFVLGGPVSVLPADLDNDNDLDLAVGSGRLSLLLNDGMGTFGTPVYYHGGYKGTAVDLDGDDDLDLAMISGNTIAIFTNRTDIISDIEEFEGLAHPPVTFELDQNRPNPFNPSTTIGFSLDQRGHVTLALYNILGQRVRTLVDWMMPAGRHAAAWDGKDENGHQMPSGVYFYQLSVNDFRQSRKMVLLK